MSDYKFYRKDFFISRNYIHLLPTIVIQTNNLMWVEENIAIQFHWLCFNGRLMWMKGTEHE